MKCSSIGHTSRLLGSVFSVGIMLSLGMLQSQASTYSTSVLSDNPIAYYRLNETSGTVATNMGTAGAAINGTYVNIPGMTANNSSLLGDAGPRPALFPGFDASNNSIFFDPEDGSTDTSTTFPRVEVGVPDDSATSPLAFGGAFTLEAWIKRGEDTIDTGNNEGIVGRYRQSQNGGARSYVFYFDSTTDGTLGNPDGTPGLGLAMSSSPTGAFQSANSYEFAADIPIGAWTHVAAVFDPGNRVSVYVNGELAGEVTTGVLNSSLYTGEGDFWIGQQFNGNDAWTFEGNIDEVAVYTNALTENQITAHYKSAVPEPATFVLLFVSAVTGIIIRFNRK